YYYLDEGVHGDGSAIVSITSNQNILDDDLGYDFITITSTFEISLIEVVTENNSIRIHIDDKFTVLNNAFYDEVENETILSLSTPFSEYYNYMASSAEAIKVKVIVAPGRYKLADTLVLSNDNVDLVSLTGNTDVELDLTDDNFYTGEVDL